MGELGNHLVAAREARGLTLEDAERDTRISRRYLQALETEQFEVIPAPVYARGFLRSYSQYLGLDAETMLGLFPREDDPLIAGGGPASRASRQHPLPPTSPSRPAWTRPGPRGNGTAAPNPFAPSSGTAPKPPPAVVPETPTEPTIGIDIAVPVPARRLDRDPAAGRRNALVAALAIGAVVAVLAVAWAIASLADGDSSSSPEAVDTPEPGRTAPSSPASPTVPTVPRGVVPDVIGLPAVDAAAVVAAAGYEVVETRERSPNVTRGNVLDQSPAPGTQLAEGQVVRLRVSDGP